MSLAQINQAIQYHVRHHDDAQDPEARKDHLFALGILTRQRNGMIRRSMANGHGINYGPTKGDPEC